MIPYGIDLFQVVACDPIEKYFLEVFMLICLSTVIAYFIWYVFKFFRFLYRLGFQR